MSLSRLVSLLFATGLALMAFGAVYRPEALGYLAASPGVLLIAMTLVLLPLAQRGARSPAARDALRLLAWGVAASLISLLVFGGSSLYAAKSASLLLLSAVWLAPLLCIDHLRMSHLRRGLWVALLISALGYVVGDLFRGSLPAGLQSLVFGGGYDAYEHTRARGFMQENSHFATLVGRDLILLYLLFEARRPYVALRLTLFLVALALLLAALGSKGAAVSIAVTIVSIGLTRRQLPYFIVLAPLVVWLGTVQVEALTYDIENFTSASTRLTLALAAVAALVTNPLGYGYYGYYGAIQHFGGWSMAWLGERLPLILTELTEIVEELSNVSAKSTLLDFGLIFGLPFLLVVVRVIRRIKTADPRARAALTYLLLSSLATSGHESISLFLGLAVLLRLYPRAQPVVAQGRGRRALGSADSGDQRLPQTS